MTLAPAAFTDLVGCRWPLQLAAMGGVGTPELAGAVAAAGGLGMLPAVAEGPVGPRLERAQALAADGPVGVNFLVPFLTPDGYDDVELAGARARVVEFFWGEPDPRLVGLATSAIVSWQVGSADEARAARDAGCQLVVAQGVEAGGHVRGSVGVLPLLAEVLDAVGDGLPVIAAGGIATAAGVAAVLAAGAAAVRVGTRFVATRESAAHEAYVDALVAATGADTVLTTTFGLGWPDAPHRVLRRSVEAVERHERGPGAAAVATVAAPDGTTVPLPCRTPMPPTVGLDGNVEAMALYAGQGVGAVSARRPAAEVVAELVAGLPAPQAPPAAPPAAPPPAPGSPRTSGG
jgi:NAD(P)H-dependent flavin oxidoreductase YrpB (nitropropane dioxygenase family)